MYADEFDQIKDIVKDFRLAGELFNKKSKDNSIPYGLNEQKNDPKIEFLKAFMENPD